MKKNIVISMAAACFTGLLFRSNAQETLPGEKTEIKKEISQGIQRFSVKLTGAYLLTHESSKMLVVGGDITADDALQGGVAVAYHFTPWWSAELSVHSSIHKLELTKANLSDLKMRGHNLSFGKVSASPLTLSGRFHIPLWDKAVPYAGIGVTYMLLKKVNTSWMIEDISYKNVWGGTAMIGLDYNLAGDHWFLNAEICSGIIDRSSLDLDVSNIIDGGQLPGQIKLNSTSFSIGVGYRF